MVPPKVRCCIYSWVSVNECPPPPNLNSSHVGTCVVTYCSKNSLPYIWMYSQSLFCNIYITGITWHPNVSNCNFFILHASATFPYMCKNVTIHMQELMKLWTVFCASLNLQAQEKGYLNSTGYKVLNWHTCWTLSITSFSVKKYLSEAVFHCFHHQVKVWNMLSSVTYIKSWPNKSNRLGFTRWWKT